MCALVTVRSCRPPMSVTSMVLAATDPPPDTLAILSTWEGAFDATFTVTVMG